MKPRGCTATLDYLVRVYPDDDLKRQLAQTYRVQIGHVLQELEVLMRRYRTRVAEEVYEREKAGHQLIEAWVVTEPTNVYTLERSLKYLLRRQQAIDAPKPGARA